MEIATYLRFVFALIFVLSLIALAAWAVRRLGIGGAISRAGGKERRLGVVEALVLDGKHRLVLIRRDGVEHLLLLGSTNDIAIETAIPAPPRPETRPAAPATEEQPT